MPANIFISEASFLTPNHEASQHIARISAHLHPPSLQLEGSSLDRKNCKAKGGAPAFKAAILGTAGGIGQPLAMLMKMNPQISLLHLYYVVNSPGMTRDNFFKKNVGIIGTLCEGIVKCCPSAVFITVCDYPLAFSITEMNINDVEVCGKATGCGTRSVFTVGVKTHSLNSTCKADPMQYSQVAQRNVADGFDPTFIGQGEKVVGFVQKKLMHSKNEEVGIILLATEETKNNLQKEVRGYLHVVVLQDIKDVIVDDWRKVPKGTSNGDFFDAIVVVMNMLLKKFGPTNKGKHGLCLITDSQHLVKKPDGLLAIGRFLNLLKLILKEVDPATMEAEERGVENEYQLEDLQVVAADYMLRVSVLNFKNAWESMGPDYERIDKYGLGVGKSLAEAVITIINILGMQPCEGTDVVPNNARSGDEAIIDAIQEIVVVSDVEIDNLEPKLALRDANALPAPFDAFPVPFD